MANKNSSSEKPLHDPNDEEMQMVDEALASALNEAAENAAHAGNDEANVDELQSALADARKRTLMAQAELENFRKRARRDQADQLRYAAMPLIKDLLPVVDNFQRAIESSQADPESSDVLTGIEMVQRMLSDVLTQHGCQRVGEIGEEFDPMMHEAIGHHHDATVPANHVLQVVQDGYRLHDRIVRPTHVIVSKGPQT